MRLFEPTFMNTMPSFLAVMYAKYCISEIHSYIVKVKWENPTILDATKNFERKNCLLVSKQSSLLAVVLYQED